MTVHCQEQGSEGVRRAMEVGRSPESGAIEQLSRREAGSGLGPVCDGQAAPRAT